MPAEERNEDLVRGFSRTWGVVSVHGVVHKKRRYAGHVGIHAMRLMWPTKPRPERGRKILRRFAYFWSLRDKPVQLSVAGLTSSGLGFHTTQEKPCGWVRCSVFSPKLWVWPATVSWAEAKIDPFGTQMSDDTTEYSVQSGEVDLER